MHRRLCIVVVVSVVVLYIYGNRREQISQWTRDVLKPPKKNENERQCRIVDGDAALQAAWNGIKYYKIRACNCAGNCGSKRKNKMYEQKKKKEKEEKRDEWKSIGKFN